MHRFSPRGFIDLRARQLMLPRNTPEDVSALCPYIILYQESCFLWYAVTGFRGERLSSASMTQSTSACSAQRIALAKIVYSGSSLHVYIYIYIHAYSCIYTYMYTHMYVCVYIYIMHFDGSRQLHISRSRPKYSQFEQYHCRMF